MFVGVMRCPLQPFVTIRESPLLCNAIHLPTIPQQIFHTKSLGAVRAPTSSCRSFKPLDFVLRTLRALRPSDPRIGEWIVCYPLNSVLASGQCVGLWIVCYPENSALVCGKYVCRSLCVSLWDSVFMKYCSLGLQQEVHKTIKLNTGAEKMQTSLSSGSPAVAIFSRH